MTVDKEQFIYDYNSMQLKDLAKKYKVTKCTIWNYAKRLGLKKGSGRIPKIIFS